MSDEDELTDNLTDNLTDSMGNNRSGVKGLKWTKTEDNMLKTLVEQYGEKWDLIASELKDRSDIQCQQRWTKVVNPDLIKGPWTKEVNFGVQVKDWLNFSSFLVNF
jgi:Myb-like DNA-binding domain